MQQKLEGSHTAHTSIVSEKHM